MADYILRSDAIQCAKDQADDFNNENLFSSAEGALAVAEWLEDVPSADVRPVVSAEWERPKGSTPRSWIFVCSKCGDRAYFPVPKYFPKGCGYNFCPNCGADMREVKEDG